MAEESEKRFHAIMDKLFHTPSKPKSSPSTTASTSTSGVQSSRGKKRPVTALAVSEPNPSVSGGTVKVPLCRPWDRGDLLKRLATFKSMTWFAKPKVVSAVNCARRGWINVDSDIIACEACGARLLFSTPSSWTQHQVEKAALVFSLKLDNGHKLLCPWVDNACDEKLAQFPPMPSTDLVDNYKKHVSGLLQLSALPVISSSAIDYMRSPQLEHFLNEFSIGEFGNKSADSSTTEYLGNEVEAVLSALYYQALKIISLCGWEPRSLPYIVNYKDQEHLSAKEGNLSGPPHAVYNGHSPSISLYSSATDENVEANDNPMTSGVKYDPSSVVLDCRLCGASIGLWAFSTASPPVEFLRLVGCSGVNSENDIPHSKENIIQANAEVSTTPDSGNGNRIESREIAVNIATSCTTSLIEMPPNLNMTIAGGPPPAKQNFQPTISLPVIGRNLRARVSLDSEFRDHQCVKSSLQGDKHHTANTVTVKEFQIDMGLEQGKGHDDGNCDSRASDLLQCLYSESSERGETLGIDRNHQMPIEGENISGPEIPESDTSDSVMESRLNNTQIVVLGSNKHDKLPENVASVGIADSAVGDPSSSQVGNSSIMTSGHHVSRGSGGTSLNDSLLIADAVIGDQNQGTETICSKHEDNQDGHGVGAKVQPVNNNIVPYCTGKDVKQQKSVTAMEFDPIRQHRHFCPWIASSGNSSPGWQQTLSALLRQKEFSFSSSPKTPSSLIQVDDPVASVKKLFTSPSAKKRKVARGS